jgi:trimethylamine--corrinoid protein Co-methyltransferase
MFCSVLNGDQIGRIHRASMTILERVGVQVPHEDMLGRLESAGASVDRASQRARMTEELVMRCVAQAGKRFTIYGRDLARTASFGAGRRNYNSVAGEAHWVDEPGGPRRYATLEDVRTAARFCDALENVNIAGAMSDPRELPPAVRVVEVTAELIRNTTKPVHFWFHDGASARYVVEMLIALRGDQKRAEEFPLFYPFLEPISPLRFPRNGLDVLYQTARLNLPVPIGPMAQMGLSAPCSVAGTMAQENAEILAGLVMTQLIRPGTPVCYGGICHAFDMRTTQLIFSGPEQAIFGVAMTQLGKHYGLPVYINVGLTDSKRCDAQAGLEIAATLVLGAAAGADVFGHMGICGVDQATSLDMLTLQDEAIAYVESALRDVDFSDQALGADVIECVGPGGSFIDTDHTAERFRRELWFPRLLDRQYFQAWQDGGALSTEDRCRRRKQEILSAHQVEPISPELDRALKDIVRSARRNLRA